jgi:hypothetical protein
MGKYPLSSPFADLPSRYHEYLSLVGYQVVENDKVQVSVDHNTFFLSLSGTRIQCCGKLSHVHPEPVNVNQRFEGSY